jgi:pseudouridine-5'-phosphate glycosidase
VTPGRLLESSHELGLQSGILLAVPIPASQAAAGGLLAAAIQTSLEEADRKGIAGRDVTPYILSRYVHCGVVSLSPVSSKSQ